MMGAIAMKIRESIQFMYIKRSIVIEGFAGITFIAGFKISSELLAVDGFGQYPGAGSLANSSGSTKKKSLG